MKVDDETEAAVLEIDLAEGEEGEIDDDEVALTSVNDAATPNSNKDEELSAKWVTAAGHERISYAIGAVPNVTCHQCDHERTSRKRLATC